MNVLIVYAHPEPRSLNGALKDFAVARLEAAGHAVQVSDLYAMGWKAVLDAGDSLEREASERFDPSATSCALSRTVGRASTSPVSRTSCAGPIR